MTLIRMFHYSCDASLSSDCEDEMGDEWYASLAKSRAKEAGWHIRKGQSICPECWDEGARFTP